jgi:predicted DNA-binding transcriptional regulator AlpA
MPDANVAPVLLTETEVSKQLRVSLAALRKWRVMNRGPQFLKIGSLVRYRQCDVDNWLASLPVGGGPCQADLLDGSSQTSGSEEPIQNELRASKFRRPEFGFEGANPRMSRAIARHP